MAGSILGLTLNERPVKMLRQTMTVYIFHGVLRDYMDEVCAALQCNDNLIVFSLSGCVKRVTLPSILMFISKYYKFILYACSRKANLSGCLRWLPTCKHR